MQKDKIKAYKEVKIISCQESAKRLEKLAFKSEYIEIS